MDENKGESYLDDLLKEIELNPVSYDSYTKKSENKSTSTASAKEEDGLSGFFSDQEIEEDFGDLDDINWDDVPLEDESFGDIEFPDFDMSELEKPLEDTAPEEENISLEEVVALDEIESEEVSLDKITFDEIVPDEPVSEEMPDNLVENLLDNLDDMGSLGALDLPPEEEKMDVPEEKLEEEGMESENMDDLDALMNSLTQGGDGNTEAEDDLLSLLADTDFEAVGEVEEESQDTSGDDIFSLDSMLGDLGDLTDLDSFADDESTKNEALPESSLEQEDMDSLSLDATLGALDEASTEEKPGKKKRKKEKKEGEEKPLFEKLFGNVHDEKAAKKMEAALKAKEEKEKNKKPKKTKEELAEEKKLKAQEKKEKQEEAKKIKEAKKKEKDELKRKKKEAQKQEEEVDEGRINRVGATIVFAFFAVVAAGVIFGSKGFAYSNSIKKATEFFGIREYTQAYDEVRGVDVKEDDQEIYDKIVTVMYVNKQLNSYNNYYRMKMYPEALDSLLKGLKRYDEYISVAKELGIANDMDYVRKQIMGELADSYNLSEEEAHRISTEEDQNEYSRQVIEKASIK